MEIVTNLIAADEDECNAVVESKCPLNEWSGIDLPGFDTEKIVTLHVVLTGDSLPIAFDLYEPICMDGNESMLLRIADELHSKLCELDEDALEAVVTELVATEEFERSQWDEEDVLDQLSSVVELAQLAESQGQVLFVWIHAV